NDFSSFGLNCYINFAQSNLPARIFAIYIKWFIPIAQKNDKRCAKVSMSIPALIPVRTYSNPSAKVYASSISLVAPASCIWYPEMEIELNFGIYLLVYSKISAMIFIEGVGG